MSCFNPSLMKCVLDRDTNQLVWTFCGTARFCDASDFGSYEDLETKGFFYLPVPCRHCLGCRIDYSRTWANRMCLELQDVGKAIFVTLTYNEEFVPWTDPCYKPFDDSPMVRTLNKRDIQLFFKRLRKKFKSVKIRYYLAGEYGPRTHRPHYHAIIFGLSLDDFDDISVWCVNELKQPSFRSDVFESVWQKGICTLSDVNYDTCAYVARYTLKKHFHDNYADLHGAVPEFSLCSRRPGIGLSQYQSILESSLTHLTFATSDGVHTIPIPRSIIVKGRTDEKYLDYCNYLSYIRLKNSSDRLRSELLWNEETYNDFLKRNLTEFKERIKLLPERM